MRNRVDRQLAAVSLCHRSKLCLMRTVPEKCISFVAVVVAAVIAYCAAAAARRARVGTLARAAVCAALGAPSSLLLGGFDAVLLA